MSLDKEYDYISVTAVCVCVGVCRKDIHPSAQLTLTIQKQVNWLKKKENTEKKTKD